MDHWCNSVHKQPAVCEYPQGIASILSGDILLHGMQVQDYFYFLQSACQKPVLTGQPLVSDQWLKD